MNRPAQPASAANPLVTFFSAEHHRQMVEKAAYFRAQRRGFKPGHELEDWLTAEREVNFALGRDKPEQHNPGS